MPYHHRPLSILSHLRLKPSSSSSSTSADKDKIVLSGSQISLPVPLVHSYTPSGRATYTTYTTHPAHHSSHVITYSPPPSRPLSPKAVHIAMMPAAPNGMEPGGGAGGAGGAGGGLGAAGGEGAPRGPAKGNSTMTNINMNAFARAAEPNGHAPPPQQQQQPPPQPQQPPPPPPPVPSGPPPLAAPPPGARNPVRVDTPQVLQQHAHLAQPPPLPPPPPPPQHPASPSTRHVIAEASKLPLPRNGGGGAGGNHGRVNTHPVLHQPPPMPAHAPPDPPRMSSPPPPPLRRPRADSDASRRRLEAFAASSDAGTSMFGAHRPVELGPDPDPHAHPSFRPEPRRGHMPAAATVAPTDATRHMFVIEDDGRFVFKESPLPPPLPGGNRLGNLAGQNENYWSEPNMNTGPSRRTKLPTRETGLSRSFSTREKERVALDLEDEGRASSPTVQQQQQQSRREHGAGRHHADSRRRSAEEDGGAGARGGDGAGAGRAAKRHSGYRDADLDYDYDHNRDPKQDLDDDMSDDVGEIGGRTPRASRTRHPQTLMPESSMPPPAQPRKLMPATINTAVAPVASAAASVNHRKRPAPDYDDAALAEMDYAALSEEPFDRDPAREAAVSGSAAATAHEGLSLPQKLLHFSTQDPSTQKTLFARMALDDWETAGDWFMERFADVARQLREARRRRRELMAEYEVEISRRGEEVRLKGESLQRRLDQMKQDGMRAMGGAEM